MIRRDLAPFVDPQANPATEAVAKTIFDAGWPVEAMVQWAELAVLHTAHVLSLSVSHRLN